jgi:hypothetical protein
VYSLGVGAHVEAVWGFVHVESGLPCFCLLQNMSFNRFFPLLLVSWEVWAYRPFWASVPSYVYKMEWIPSLEKRTLEPVLIKTTQKQRASQAVRI